MENTIILQLKEFLTQKIERLKKYSAYSPEAIKLATESFQAVLTEIERLEKENPSFEDTAKNAFESFAKEAEKFQENLTQVVREGYKTIHTNLEKVTSELFKATKPKS